MVCRGGIYPSREVSGGGRLRGVEDAAPYDNGIVYGFPQTGNAARLRRGEGTPPYGWGYGNAVGFTRAPVPGPPRGRGRACPARGVAWAEVCGWFVGRGLDPSAGDCPGIGGDARSPLIRPCGATFPQGGRQGVVGEGFIPPGVFAATQASAGRRGRRPLRVARERATPQGCGGVRAPRPTDGVYVSVVGAAYMPPAGLRGQPFPGRSVGRGLDPSAGGCPGTGGGGRSPLIRPCGATFPQGGRRGL